MRVRRGEVESSEMVVRRLLGCGCGWGRVLDLGDRRMRGLRGGCGRVRGGGDGRTGDEVCA